MWESWHGDGRGERARRAELQLPVLNCSCLCGRAYSSQGRMTIRPATAGNSTLLQMKGCEAWKALCLPADSKVAQCKEPGAAPNVPTTYQTKKDIDVSSVAQCGWISELCVAERGQ